MSVKIINNKEIQNIIRLSSNQNEKKPIKPCIKKSAIIPSKNNLKTEYKQNFDYGYNNIINNEKDEFSESSESQDTTIQENKEKQLVILIEKYTKLYNSKEKIYSNIIKEIDIEKHLFYKGSINSFNLMILKIKCLFKLLKEKFDTILTSKEQRNYYEVDLSIQKIKNEFKKINYIISEDNKYEYEILTQVYCKFLFIMSIISSKKEEYIKSLSYVALGVNTLKVFFVRQGIATDIETYKIYAKLIILLINRLLIDNNISQALIYINVLTKISQIAINIIYKNKLNKKYEYNFHKYNGYAFLFLGYCYELKTNIQNNTKISLKAYKEAYYFMNKAKGTSIFAEKGIITIENKEYYLSQLLYEKLKDKLIYEALEKQKEFEQKERLKKQLIEEEKLREKRYKLKLIASGCTPDTSNLVQIQRKIYNEILTPSNQKLIDKLDDELISYVYKDKQNHNNSERKEITKIKLNEKKLTNSSKKCGKLEKKLPSMEIMKNLCHYKMYNSLMSNDFKEFILHNKKLQFNNPQKQKISLDKIQKYLNRKMEIDSISEITNKEKDKEKDSQLMIRTEANISSRKNRNYKILNLKNQNVKKIILIKKNTNEHEQDSSNYIKYINNNQAKSSKPLSTYISNSKRSFIVSRDKERENNSNRINKLNNKRIITHSNYSPSSYVQPNSNKLIDKEKKYNSKSMTSQEIEAKKSDKYIFNKKYFKEFQYLERLTDKELDFQKQFLELKNNNSKMYFKGFDTELSNNGKVSRDEIYKSFLILHDKVVSQKRNYEREIKDEIERKNKPKILGNVFKSVTKKIKEGKTAKNAMRKVLDRYISEQKNIHKNRNLLNLEEINKKNEYSIMKLNDNINEINYLLLSKSIEAKHNNNYTGFL